ncbi:ATP-binding protein [Pinisolibacter sp.]|uniref:ATP-binding protein n=1 Tax=Pinisolibacter sp. TaxID=2172024 RepID=UPI002FDECC43
MRRPNFESLVSLTFLVLMGLLLAAIGTAWSGLNHQATTERKLIDRNFPSAELARGMARSAEVATAAVTAAERAPDRRGLDGQAASLRGELDAIDDRLRALAPLIGEIETIRELRERSRDSRARGDELVAAVRHRFDLDEMAIGQREAAGRAASDLATVAGTLIANAQAQMSAGLSGLYETASDAERAVILDKLAEEDLFVLQSMTEVREVARRLVFGMDGLTTASDTVGLAAARARIAEDVRMLDQRLERIVDPTRRTQAMDLAARFDRAVLGEGGLAATRGEALATETRIAALARDTSAAANLVSASAREIMRTIEAEVLAFQHQTLATSQWLVALVGSLGVFALLATLVIGRYLKVHVLSRLTRVTSHLVALGGGRLDEEVEVSGADDIGRMERALRVLQLQVRRKEQLEDQLRSRGKELEAEVTSRTEMLRQEMHAHDQARAEAEQASRSKSEFLATMSHEIRTPLNGLIGMLRLMGRPEAPGDAQRFDLARRSAGDLKTLLDDILEHAKVELGDASPKTDAFEVRGLVARVADLTAPAAATKGLRFVVDIDERLPPALRGDMSRIQQILVNLCSNAVKFTDHGEVALIAELDGADREGRLLVAFRVHDTGIGMSPEVVSRIFEAFNQIHRPFDPRAVGGTGLGLSICRRLAVALGGALAVESRPGVGSTFTLTLALEEGDIVEALAVAETEEADAPARPPFRALVVEDHDVSRMVARGFLERAGAVVDEAATGAEAIDRARREPYDIILMDLDLPDLTGGETVRRIREAGPNVTTPVVAVSAHVLGAEAAELRQADFFDFIGKPLTPVALARVLDRLSETDGRDPRTEPVPREAPTPADEVTDDVVEAALRRDVEALGREAVGAIVTAFLGRLPDEIDGLASLLEEGSDADAIRRAAHRLKGAAANFDLADFCDVMRAVETTVSAGARHAPDVVRDAGRAVAEQLEAAARRVCVDPASTGGITSVPE